MATDRTDLMRGTLDLLILKTLAPGPLHGLAISKRIEQVTQGVFRVMPGSLFPALHRLEDEGWIAGAWGESESNRAAKYYRLTKQGRRQFEAEKDNWARVALAIRRVLEA